MTPVKARINEAFRVNLPDYRRASVLVQEAFVLSRAGYVEYALARLDEVILLDPSMALHGIGEVRADLHAETGEEKPLAAIREYEAAHSAQVRGDCTTAIKSYLQAAKLDPLFLWPTNNLAWLASTYRERLVRNGREAVRLALKACESSNWSYWAFVGTLAAAYAEAGDFERAVGWQKASLLITPDDHRPEAEIILRTFEAGEPFVDHGIKLAAGVPLAGTESR